jgi:hypothetical protein
MRRHGDSSGRWPNAARAAIEFRQESSVERRGSHSALLLAAQSKTQSSAMATETIAMAMQQILPAATPSAIR